MTTPLNAPAGSREDSTSAGGRFRAQTLLAALRDRRSRRFGAGMEIPAGPLAYRSRHGPMPLSEDEEAVLAYAGGGVTGRALADLCYAPGQGGNIMSGLVGRTVASGDGIQSVALVVTNDRATHLLRRPAELSAEVVKELMDWGRAERFTEMYRRQRVTLKEGRGAPAVEPLMNLDVNRWSAHAAGTTTLVPINDLTLLYINGLLEVFSETTGAFILDERAGFRPAGIGRFAKRRGGHLEDDPARGRIATIKHVELMVSEFAAIEQGMIVQNLALACEALGLGGFPHFANHETGWFEALGFRMGSLPVSRYLGMNRLTSWGLRLLGRDVAVPYPMALEVGGEMVLRPYCPPGYPTMRHAVEAVVARKQGVTGIFSPGHPWSAWKEGDRVGSQVPRISEAAIEATVAYVEYVWERYGRFPAHVPPYRTVVAFQAAHVDAEFYDRFYRPEALGARQREDYERWSRKADLKQEPGLPSPGPAGRS